MSKKMKMVVNESLILWAFACAADHEGAAAALIALIALACTVSVFTAQKIRKHLIASLILADLQLVIAHVSGITAIIPSVSAVIAVNSVFAVMTFENNAETADFEAAWMLRIFLAYAMLAMIMPSGQFSFLQLMTLISMIFAPLLAVYTIRSIKEAERNDQKLIHDLNGSDPLS